MNDLVLGLDLGSSHVAMCILGLQGNGRLTVEAASSVPARGIQKGVITHIEDAASCIRECRQELGANDFTEAVVGISGPHLEGMSSKGYVPIIPIGRTITSGDVLQVVNHSRQIGHSPEREQILSVPREFMIDGVRGITRPVGLSGSRLEVVTHVITGQISHLNNVQKVVEMAGLEVAQLVPSSVAVGMGLLRQEEMEVGAAVIDIGAHTTAISVYFGGAVAYTANLAIGSHHVTNDIMMLLKTSPEDAESLKKRRGGAIQGKKKDESTVEIRQIGQIEMRHLHRHVLIEIIESRMREIATMAKQHIQRSGYMGLLPGGILVTGGGSLLPGTPQLFAQVLGDANVRLGTPDVDGPAGIRVSGPEWSACLGLGAYALSSGEEVSPASGFAHWTERIKTFFQLKV
jgi:cell division protein FtsA